jgi:hypothetical protein
MNLEEYLSMLQKLAEKEKKRKENSARQSQAPYDDFN